MASELKRMRYYNGLFMKREEFQTDQDYHNRLRRLHNAHLHSPGIVYGLEVTALDESDTVRVSPGLALTRYFDEAEGELHSRELIFASETDVNLRDYPADETLYLWLRFQETATDLTVELGSDFTRFLERPLLEHGAVKPPDEEGVVMLARIVVQSDGGITASSIFGTDSNGSELRILAGVGGERGVFRILGLRNPTLVEGFARLEGRHYPDAEASIEAVADRFVFSGEALVQGQLSAAGDLSVAGATTVTGPLTVNGGLQLASGVAANEISDDADFTDSSASAVPTERAVKEYVDARLVSGRRFLGEIFMLKDYASFSVDFPAICISNASQTVNLSNWPDLQPFLYGIPLRYDPAGANLINFAITAYSISSSLLTWTFADTPANRAILAALAEDQLVQGSYADWLTVTNEAQLGPMTPGTHAIANVNATLRQISVPFTGPNTGSTALSGSLRFYLHRIAGQPALARIFQVAGRGFITAGDADHEWIGGLRRRDRMQGHWHELAPPAYGIISGYTYPANGISATYTSNLEVRSPISDGVNGAPRTGRTTDIRGLAVFAYLWGGRYFDSSLPIPTTLAIENAGFRQSFLQVSASDPNLMGYELFWKAGSAPDTEFYDGVFTVAGAGVQSVVHQDLVEGTTYWYRARAVLSNGLGALSGPQSFLETTVRLATYTVPGSYNWTPGANITYVAVGAIGGGGGGGGGGSQGIVIWPPFSAGSGGGGGAASRIYVTTNVIPGQLHSLSVGAHGSGGAGGGQGGAAGGDSFFQGSIRGEGGAGGGGGATHGFGNGGAGGSNPPYSGGVGGTADGGASATGGQGAILGANGLPPSLSGFGQTGGAGGVWPDTSYGLGGNGAASGSNTFDIVGLPGQPGTHGVVYIDG